MGGYPAKTTTVVCEVISGEPSDGGTAAITVSRTDTTAKLAMTWRRKNAASTATVRCTISPQDAAQSQYTYTASIPRGICVGEGLIFRDGLEPGLSCP